MPTTTIHFVRHGKVYNPDHLLYERLPGFHLSDRGMRMAQATGAYIAADPKLNTVAAVYSSPLERTRETAGAFSTRSTRYAPGVGRSRWNSSPTACDRSGQRVPRQAHRTWQGRAVARRQLEARAQPVEAELGRVVPAHRRTRGRVREREDPRVCRTADHRRQHESPIWSYRHLLETGHPEHWMFLRKTALASITSITYDSDTGKVMSITYADPAAQVE